jgi:sugar phosphate isomerase/epimerase
MKDIPLISVGFDGYDLGRTLDGLRRTASTNVCLCALDGFTQHVVPETMSREEWENTRRMFEIAGLKLFGLEGHCDLSDAANREKIRRRMEFTRFMGGRYIDLSAGPKGSERAFYEQAGFVADLAGELDITVCLETHGDMIDSGKSGNRILKKVGSERIRLCYDPANIYFYSRGEKNPIEDVEYALECTALIHYKGVSRDADGGRWSFPFMEEAVFDYERFFGILSARGYVGMAAIEIERMFSYRDSTGFVRDELWTVEDIVGAYNHEIAYLAPRLDSAG